MVQKYFLGSLYQPIYWHKLEEGDQARQGQEGQWNHVYMYIILGSCLPVPQKLEVVHRAIDDSYELAEADALRGRFRRER